MHWGKASTASFNSIQYNRLVYVLTLRKSEWSHFKHGHATIFVPEIILRPLLIIIYHSVY